MDFKVTVVIPLEVIDNLLCSAFEGGSNYWATRADIRKKDPGGEATYTHEMPQRGGELYIYDGEEGKKYALNLKAIQRGLEAMSKWGEEDGAHHWAHVIAGNDGGQIDADTGDAFLQACLFGKLIYG